jgi:hypothetical protein
MASASAVSRAQRFRHKAATRILRIAVVERTFGTFGLIGASATNRHHRAGDVRRLFVLVRRATAAAVPDGAAKATPLPTRLTIPRALNGDDPVAPEVER